MEINILSTPRLTLRELTPTTYTYLFEHYTDQELMEFLRLQDTEVLDMEKDKHAKGTTTYNKSFVYFQILDKQTDSFIGGAGFHTWYLAHNRAEIGYAIEEEHNKNKGYMKEAILPILQYGFSVLGLHRIEAMIGPKNIPSQKLIGHYGFQQEGIMKSHYLKMDQYEDSMIFGLLAADFTKVAHPPLVLSKLDINKQHD